MSTTNFITDHYRTTQATDQTPEGHVVWQILTRQGVMLFEGVGDSDATAIADLCSQALMTSCTGCGRELVTATDSPATQCVKCQIGSLVHQPNAVQRAMKARITRSERAFTQHALTPEQAAALKARL